MKPSFSDINIIDIDQAHLLGRVHSIVTGSAVDGPGIRVAVFLQGCQFQCKYCHNRDTWDINAGKLYTVSELMDKILSYAVFMDKSNGGVTISGGEAMLQADFVGLLFKQLKRMNIHTCLDTNGYVSRHLYGEKLDLVLRHSDLVLLDIKQMDDAKHQALTGISNKTTLKFAHYLNQIGQHTRVRYVVVPGYTDAEEDIRSLARFVRSLPCIQLVELLPYHQMGKEKWLDLGFPYPLESTSPPTSDDVQKVKGLLQSEYGIKVLL